MTFGPTFRLGPRMLRQLEAIEQTTGFLEAVRLRSEWVADVRSRTNVKEAFASLQIEGSALTLQRAFALSREIPRRELRDSEREFYNYLRAFEATDALRNQRDAVLSRGDLRNLHRLLVEGVRGGRWGAGEFRREDVKVGDVHGRTVRMFTTLLLYQRGYDFEYLFELSSYYNPDCDAYTAALRSADSTGDYTEWLTYFLGGFAYQMVDIEQLARGGEG